MCRFLSLDIRLCSLLYCSSAGTDVEQPKRKKTAPKAREAQLKAPPTRGPDVFDAQGKLLFSREEAVQKKRSAVDRRKRNRQKQTRHNEHASGDDDEEDDERDEHVSSSEEDGVPADVPGRKHAQRAKLSTTRRRSSRKFSRW